MENKWANYGKWRHGEQRQKIIDDMNSETKIQLQQELIELYENQIMDLVMMSKIELGDDVIEEITRLKALINEQSR